jgi:RNA polymerase sigma-70 factor (ECF subfamily)
MTTGEQVELEDQDLMRRMALKDAEALEAFYDRYYRVAFALVVRIVKVRQDAEDVLAEVFWQVWRQSDRYSSSRGKPLAWLLTIARTRALDSLRAASRRESPGPGGEETEKASSRPGMVQQEDPFVLAATRMAVSRCLESLSMEQRTPLEMAYFQGMSHSEIAAALSQPLGTMKDRIRTGMMQLRKCLKPYEARA